VKNREGKPGGWAFEFENAWYPDVDDSAVVVMALGAVDHPDAPRVQAALARASQWIETMQCKNGGWAHSTSTTTKIGSTASRTAIEGNDRPGDRRCERARARNVERCNLTVFDARVSNAARLSAERTRDRRRVFGAGA